MRRSEQASSSSVAFRLPPFTVTALWWPSTSLSRRPCWEALISLIMIHDHTFLPASPSIVLTFLRACTQSWLFAPC